MRLPKTLVPVVVLMSVSMVYAAQPAGTPPAATTTPAAASVSTDARALLDKIDAAYRGLSALSLTGTFGADINVAGQKQNESCAFTAAYSSEKLQFKHDAQDEMLVVSNGETMYAFRPSANSYVSQTSPTEKLAIADLPQPYQMILRTQNPSLVLALSKAPADELTHGVSSVTRGADITIAGTACPSLILSSSDGSVVTAAIDPTTNLLRQVKFDLKKVLESRHAPNVQSATLTIDYAKINVGKEGLPEFAWAPPIGSKDESQAASAEQLNDPSQALVNNPAPDFTLKNEDDKDQKLSDMKGSVVILDFWATWCPPCREGLPVLDTLAKDNAAKGVKVFAVNLREAKDVVSGFKKKTALTLPVLFDSEGAIADIYKVKGIPQTVVIDKKGVVRKVIVGFDPAEKAALEKLVSELAKQ